LGLNHQRFVISPLDVKARATRRQRPQGLGRWLVVIRFAKRLEHTANGKGALTMIRFSFSIFGQSPTSPGRSAALLSRVHSPGLKCEPFHGPKPEAKSARNSFRRLDAVREAA
jgi:hypothetical protein